MNPLNYNIRNGDLAICLASNQEHANLLTKYPVIDPNSSAMWHKICHKQFKLDESLAKHINIHRNYSFRKVKCELGKSEYYMWNDDLRGKLKDHIVIVGPIETLDNFIEHIRYYTSNYIAYITDKPILSQFKKLTVQYIRVIYIQCNIYIIYIYIYIR